MNNTQRFFSLCFAIAATSALAQGHATPGYVQRPSDRVRDSERRAREYVIPTTMVDECVLPVEVPRYLLVCGGDGEWWVTPLLGPDPTDADLNDNPPGSRCVVYDLEATEARGVYLTEPTGESEGHLVLKPRRRYIDSSPEACGCSPARKRR